MNRVIKLGGFKGRSTSINEADGMIEFKENGTIVNEIEYADVIKDELDALRPSWNRGDMTEVELEEELGELQAELDELDGA